MRIQNVIVHKLNKERAAAGGRSEATIEFRKTELNSSSSLTIAFIEKIIESFKTGKTFGTFDEDEDNYPFQKWLKEMYDPSDDRDFISLSKSTMERLRILIQNKNFATGGHIVFCSYSDAGKNWFIVVMLKDKDGYTFEDLELKNVQELDIDKLHQLARVDVNAWSEEHSSAYLSFISKKSEDISEYFIEALGCTNLVHSKVTTNAVLEIIDTLFLENKVKKEDADVAKDQLYDFLIEKRKTSKSVKLEEISTFIDHHLPEDKHGAFIEMANSDNFQVSEQFEPNPQVLRNLKRIKHKTTYWTLDIDRKALGQAGSGSDVEYNEKQNSLTVNNLPSELAVELAKSIE